MIISHKLVVAVVFITLPSLCYRVAPVLERYTMVRR